MFSGIRAFFGMRFVQQLSVLFIYSVLDVQSVITTRSLVKHAAFPFYASLTLTSYTSVSHTRILLLIHLENTW